MKLWDNYNTKMPISSGPQRYTMENPWWNFICDKKELLFPDLQTQCYYYLSESYQIVLLLLPVLKLVIYLLNEICWVFKTFSKYLSSVWDGMN